MLMNSEEATRPGLGFEFTTCLWDTREIYAKLTRKFGGGEIIPMLDYIWWNWTGTERAIYDLQKCTVVNDEFKKCSDGDASKPPYWRKAPHKLNRNTLKPVASLCS